MRAPDSIFFPGSAITDERVARDPALDPPLPEIPNAPSIALSGFEIRLDRVFVKRDGEIGKGEIRVISTVTVPGNENGMVVKTPLYSGVRKKTELPIREADTLLYRHEGPLPEYFTVDIAVVEVDENQRKAGERITRFLAGETWGAIKGTAKNLPQPLGVLADGITGGLSEKVMGFLGRILAANEDDILLRVQAGFGPADTYGVRAMPYNESNRFIDIAYRIVAV